MIAIGAAVVAAAGLTIAGGSPAVADTVNVTYSCGGFGYPQHYTTMLVTITAPATAAPGQTVTLRASISRSAPENHSYEPGVNRGELDIHLGGASSGMVKATGLVNPRIEPGTPWRLEGGQAQVTLGNSGTVTFTPGAWRLTTHPYGCGVKWDTTAPVAASTVVG